MAWPGTSLYAFIGEAHDNIYHHVRSTAQEGKFGCDGEGGGYFAGDFLD